MLWMCIWMHLLLPHYSCQCRPSIWKWARILGTNSVLCNKSYWNAVIDTVYSTQIDLTSMLNVYKVFYNLYMLWMCIWMYLTLTTLQLLMQTKTPSFWKYNLSSPPMIPISSFTGVLGVGRRFGLGWWWAMIMCSWWLIQWFNINNKNMKYEVRRQQHSSLQAGSNQQQHAEEKAMGRVWSNQLLKPEGCWNMYLPLKPLW